MSTYYQIFGGKINVVSADPSNPIEGQIWYNTTSEVLKYQTVSLGSWASGGNLSASRRYMMGTGTQTAGLAIGGTPSSNSTEEYDGTSWTGGGALGTGRYLAAASGTQTVAALFGGEQAGVGKVAITEEYNGTSWTGGGNMGTARNQLGGCGTQTAGLGFGGVVTTANTNAT
jgi:hypothetical protein